MVKDHSDSEKENPLPPHRLLLSINSKVFFYMHHPTDRITHTTAFVTSVVEHWLEREIAQWVHPMKDQSDDPSHHEQTLLPRSYISLPPSQRKDSTYQSLCYTSSVGSPDGIDPMMHLTMSKLSITDWATSCSLDIIWMPDICAYKKHATLWASHCWMGELSISYIWQH